MKRGTPDHPKVYRLMAAVGRRRPEVLGYLELLWHWAGYFAPQGDVGKWSDAEIEKAVEWDGAPGELVAGMRKCGWIDPHRKYRLLIHDYEDHADESVKKRLKRQGLWFIACRDHVETQSRHSRDTVEPLSSLAREGVGVGVGTPDLSKEVQTGEPKQGGVEESEEKGVGMLALVPPSVVPNGRGGGFEAFWLEYPKKTDKQEAREVWQRLKPDAALEAEILAGVRRLKRSEQWQCDGRKYVPNPARFLRRRKWTDEPESDEPTVGSALAQSARTFRRFLGKEDKNDD